MSATIKQERNTWRLIALLYIAAFIVLTVYIYITALNVTAAVDPVCEVIERHDVRSGVISIWRECGDIPTTQIH